MTTSLVETYLSENLLKPRHANVAQQHTTHQHTCCEEGFAYTLVAKAVAAAVAAAEAVAKAEATSAPT
jgi:hypothetical protein